MPASIRVVGGSRLRRTLKRAGAEMTDLKDVNAAIAALVSSRAAARAPRRTGRLARSIRGNRATSRATVKAGRVRVPYAGPIHWGWPARHIQPDRFLTDTAADLDPAISAMYLDGVKKAADQIKGA